MTIRYLSVCSGIEAASVEALQGFPRDWTLVPYRGKPASDGPRYKALGNFHGRSGHALDRGADSRIKRGDV